MNEPEKTALDVADHLLRCIDDAIPTNPTPEELNRLAAAFAQVAAHLPKTDLSRNPGAGNRGSRRGTGRVAVLD